MHIFIKGDFTNVEQRINTRRSQQVGLKKKILGEMQVWAVKWSVHEWKTQTTLKLTLLQQGWGEKRKLKTS